MPTVLTSTPNAPAIRFRKADLPLIDASIESPNRVSAKYSWGRKLNAIRSEEHTSELQSLMRISYAVFCLKTTHFQKKALKPHVAPDLSVGQHSRYRPRFY